MRGRALRQDSGVWPLSRALRAHVAKHNRHVLLLALGTLIGSLALWVLMYGIASWLTVLFLSAIQGSDAMRPRIFDEVFVATAVALLALACVDRWLTPNDLPRDNKSPAEIATD